VNALLGVAFGEGGAANVDSDMSTATASTKPERKKVLMEYLSRMEDESRF
jgi:hypothetical protein